LKWNAEDSQGNQFALLIFPEQADDQQRIFDHEWGHVVNCILIDALESQRRSDQWEPFSLAKLQSMIREIELDCYYAQQLADSDQAIDQEYFEDRAKELEELVLPYVFASAKDEVLADFFATGTTSDYKSILFTHRFYGIIDNFLENYIVSPIPDRGVQIIKDHLTTKYKEIGSMACNAIDEFKLVHIFQSQTPSGPLVKTETRKNTVLPFLLAQVPMKKWPTFMQEYYAARMDLQEAIKEIPANNEESSGKEFWERFSKEVRQQDISVDFLSDYEKARILRELTKETKAE
jgi:hypothetical protein